MQGYIQADRDDTAGREALAAALTAIRQRLAPGAAALTVGAVTNKVIRGKERQVAAALALGAEVREGGRRRRWAAGQLGAVLRARARCLAAFFLAACLPCLSSWGSNHRRRRCPASLRYPCSSERGCAPSAGPQQQRGPRSRPASLTGGPAGRVPTPPPPEASNL